MKKRFSESQINAELRRLTEQVRQVREELRASLREPKRTLTDRPDEPPRGHRPHDGDTTY